MSFSVNSPAFKGASVTPIASSSAAEQPQGAGALLTATSPAERPEEENVRTTVRLADMGHNPAGCNHCVGGIVNKVFEGNPDVVKSMASAAASNQQKQNFSALRAQVVAHEGKHHDTAVGGPGSQHLEVGAPNIDDAAIAKEANGEGGGTLGSVSIQPKIGTPKTAAEANEFADAFRTMGNAASAVGSDMSGADKSVAASGAAGASEMEGKAAQLKAKEGQSPQVAQGNASKADPKQPSFSISA